MDKEIIAVMKRFELKYVLSRAQVEAFQKAVQGHIKVDQYGLTTIASLYYDTPSFTMINRSIEKPLYKEKIRLRSYVLAKKGSRVFLEVKRKNDRIVYKRRIATDEVAAERFFSDEEEFDHGQIARELQALKEHYGTLEPKYLIIYDRIAYYQDDSDLRVTLDMNPRYRAEDLDLHTSLDGIPLLKEGEAILEVKVQHAIPLWLASVLTEERIYLSSFSKVGAAHKAEMNKRIHGLELVQRSMCIKEGGKEYGFAI